MSPLAIRNEPKQLSFCRCCSSILITNSTQKFHSLAVINHKINQMTSAVYQLKTIQMPTNKTFNQIWTNQFASQPHNAYSIGITFNQTHHFHHAVLHRPTQNPPRNSPHRMSMFFFRLHNLQREQENKRKKSAEQRQRQRRGGKVFRCVSDSTGHLTLAPSRLFEKTPMSPSDSLDEIALQIPR